MNPGIDPNKYLAQAIERGFLMPVPAGGFAPRQGTEIALDFLPDTRGCFADLKLGKVLAAAALEAIAPVDAEVFAGVYSSGIQWAAVLGQQAQRPHVTIRLEPRESGMRRLVEGDVAGRTLLLIDNVVRSGKSLRQAAVIGSDAGATIVGAFAVAALTEPPPRLGVPLFTCWSLDQLNQAYRAKARSSISHDVKDPDSHTP